MSNKQNFMNVLMNDWQKQMQEYLNDPRVAELMMDYYAKFQNNVQEITKEFTSQSTVNATDDANIPPEFLARLKTLEARVEFLEKFLSGAFK